jgi:hypothetical protein
MRSRGSPGWPNKGIEAAATMRSPLRPWKIEVGGEDQQEVFWGCAMRTAVCQSDSGVAGLG